ncbi:protein disulfide-isomerase A2 [Ambystoma mexicanum]|uniref:protein disulfide-isomerase A2 n=1 Tax=Ambystoma mexicanum TaxID=8296 RepID=UPI0037E97D84
MKCALLLSLLLFFLLGTQSQRPVVAEKETDAASHHGDKEQDTSEEAHMEDEERSDELQEDGEVLVLNKHNFERALREHKFLLVEFYAPWCSHCQALELEYSKAADVLKNKSSEVRLAKVNAVVEQELSGEYGVSGYPTLILFQNGNRTNPIEYSGKRNAEGFVKWMQRRAIPAVIELNNNADTEKFIDSEDVTVIGFFKDPRDADVKTFSEMALDAVDIAFGITNNDELFQKYGVSGDSIVLFKKFDEARADFNIDEDLGLDKEEFAKFIIINSLQTVTEYNMENSEKIFAAKIVNHLLLFINKTVEDHLSLLEEFRGAAPQFKGKILFVFIDTSGEHAEVLQYFGLSNEDVPTIRFINIETARKFAMPGTDLTTAAVTGFCQNVLTGKIKPNLMSEELPEDWDKHPVKVLVGKNFEEVVFDETKNVFVQFYAPWCTHCKEMDSAWNELGEKYKDIENIIIAKFDATANEIDGLRVRGFPNLKYFPAGKEKKMLEYTKERTVELFSKFLDNGGLLPEDEEETPIMEADSNEPTQSVKEVEQQEQANSTKDEL